MNNIKNLNYPAQLWLGDSDSLELSLIEHLRKNFCLNENNIICDINNNLNNVCLECAKFLNNNILTNHENILYINPEKSYTQDVIQPILDKISLNLNNNIKFYFILNKIDYLSLHCANMLLKSIEEPPEGYKFILLAQRLYQVLPTIRSRCLVSYKYSKNNNLNLNNNILSLYKVFIDLDSFSNNNINNIINSFSKLSLSDLDGILLLDKLILYWGNLYKKNINSLNNNLDLIKINKIINILNNKLLSPPYRANQKVFWRNLYLNFANL